MLKYFCQPHILVKKSYIPHIIPKTKGLEESLGGYMQLWAANFALPMEIHMCAVKESKYSHSVQTLLTEV